MSDVFEVEIEGKAVELAVALNAVADDDERERLEQLFERRLNAELFHGAELRAADLTVHPSHPAIRRHMRVRHLDGREGVVLGFSRSEWAFGRPSTTVFARVLLGNGDCPLWPVASLSPVVSEGAKS